MNDTDQRFLKQNRDLVGILGGVDAAVAPDYVVIDLTNRCNSNCVACWTYSPLLGVKHADNDWCNQQLPLAKVTTFIDEIAQMGTREIRLTGGGEPFLHPDILDIIRYIKLKKLTCAVTSNGICLDTQILDALTEIGLDILTVSIWAGNAETYVRTHPRSSPETFEHISRMLHHLKVKQGSKPGLVIANVISKVNFNNIDLMIDFALNVGAFQTYFALVDPIEGATDALLLDEKARAYVFARLCAFDERFRNADYFSIDCIDIVKRRLCAKGSSDGEYDREMVNTIPCYAGWTFARIMANGDVSPCCRGVHFPTGNIIEHSFKEIWNGSRYQMFRQMALHGNKLSPIFEKFGCTKTCDNLPQNFWLHNRIKSLSPSQRDLLLNTHINATERSHNANVPV